MRQPFPWICVLMIFVTGCKGQGNSPFKGLNSQDYETVKSLNQSQENIIQGAQRAFASFTSMAVDTAKIQKASDSIRSSGCTQQKQDPAEAYDHTWQGLWEVSSAGCPVYIHQSSFFNHDTTQWTTSRVINVKSDELRKLNGLDTLSIIGGINKQSSPGGSRLSGTLNYTQFELEKVGTVGAQILIEQSVSGTTATGSADLTLQVASAHVAASLSWSSNTPTYKVNGEETDRKTFDEVFSAFQLTEIMDRALKMR